MLQRILAGLAVLFGLLVHVSCGGGSDAKGACVGGANPNACGDDFTAGQCEAVKGDRFYEGKTCKDLGYR